MDKAAADRIKHNPCGRAQKSLSKAIVNRHPALWDILKFDVMVHADFVKFTQNQAFTEELVNSYPKHLVEDNPHDRFWGGSANNAGQILMLIRDFCLGQPDVLPSVLVVGDSLFKNLSEHRLSSESSRRCRCLSLPGAKFQYVSLAANLLTGPYIRDTVVVAGTNNLSTKQNKAKMGPRQLLKKFLRFDLQFTQSCPHSRLRLCTILNRPRNVDDRIGRHVTRFNHLLASSFADGLFSPSTCLTVFPVLDDHCFLDGLHLNSHGCAVILSHLAQDLRCTS